MELEKWFKEKLEFFKDDFDFRLETIILNITEQICEKMFDKKTTRTELAKRLEVSSAAITKILNGTSNFTLRTLLSLADSLELELNVEFREKLLIPDHRILSTSASQSKRSMIAEEDYILSNADDFLNIQPKEEGYFDTVTA